MNTFRRISLTLGAATLLVPSLAFAQAKAPAPAPAPAPAAASAPVDDFGCVLQLMWFVSEGRKMIADTKVTADKRAEMGGMLVDFGLALGYFEGRIAGLSSGDFKARSEAAFGRMKAMNDDQLSESTLACIAAHKTGETRMMDRMLGK